MGEGGACGRRRFIWEKAGLVEICWGGSLTLPLVGPPEDPTGTAAAQQPASRPREMSERPIQQGEKK